MSLAKCATMCQDKLAQTFLVKSAETFHDSSASRCQGGWRRRSATTSPGRCARVFQGNSVPMCQDSSVLMFQGNSAPTFQGNSVPMFHGKSATTLQDKFQGRNAQTCQDRNVRMCRGNSATMSLARNARTSLVSSATTCLASSAEMSLRKSATTCQEKFATMFLASSASKFPSRCATRPSQPTAESRLRELKRNEDAESGRRILPEARKRHLKLSTKLPGWSQRSYLFLLCNIYGILVKPRVLRRVNKNLVSGTSPSPSFCSLHTW